MKTMIVNLSISENIIHPILYASSPLYAALCVMLQPQRTVPGYNRSTLQTTQYGKVGWTGGEFVPLYNNGLFKHGGRVVPNYDI